MLMFAMDDQAVALLAELLPPVPHLLDKWAGGVVLIEIDAAGTEPMLDLESSTKSGYNNKIIRFERYQRNQLDAVGYKQQPDTSHQQMLNDEQIVEHLAEQIED